MWKAFTGLVRPEWKAIAAATLFIMISSVGGAAGPLLLGYMVDEVGNGTSTSRVDLIAALMLLAVLTTAVFSFASTWVAVRLGERLGATMRERFVDRCLRLPLPVVERAGSGDLMTRSSADVPEAGAMLRDGLPNVIMSSIQMLIFMAALVWISPTLSIAMLFLVPAILPMMIWFLRRAPDAYLREREVESEIGETLAASADGSRTVEAYGLAQRRREASDECISQHWAASRYILRLRTVFFPALDSSYALPTAAIFLMGGVMYFNGSMSLGVVAAAAMLSRQLILPIDYILMWIERVQRGIAALARVEGVGEVEDTDPKVAQQLPTDGAVTLRQVRFAYGDGNDVLHGVTLEIPAGQRLAVVGPSGAGKSTLARLISGVDSPRSGSVEIGGVPVEDLPLIERRKRVSLVTQDHYVFAAPVRDNLALAKEDATEEELFAALTTVGATWVAELESGLDTQVGGTNAELDAAKAQQLALARIVLADPEIVILDEATAMLDPQAARDTERALEAVLAGRTVIAIAHRLQTAHDAERVAVMEDGRVAELGSHDELLERQGTYASLWAAWHGESVLANSETLGSGSTSGGGNQWQGERLGRLLG
ncbi:ABC transporter ATP-binding protein [Natronoglycomyces albus]|uniref:ABC transporter ATP-binding protein n=2 Tax=Natronoglycomyces albus TaxID=2811108 RepID=A0A895XUF8_9ACTN|nr:ABC transporter ATP-binding protein [Natronoglycomyces albus]